jgi:hypothetical protein
MDEQLQGEVDYLKWLINHNITHPLMIYDLAFFSCVNGAFFLEYSYVSHCGYFLPTSTSNWTGYHLSYYSHWKCLFLFWFNSDGGEKGLV